MYKLKTKLIIMQKLSLPNIHAINKQGYGKENKHRTYIPYMAKFSRRKTFALT